MGLPARNPELLVIQFRGARRRQNAPNATAGAARGALRAVGLPAQQLRLAKRALMNGGRHRPSHPMPDSVSAVARGWLI